MQNNNISLKFNFANSNPFSGIKHSNITPTVPGTWFPNTDCSIIAVFPTDFPPITTILKFLGISSAFPVDVQSTRCTHGNREEEVNDEMKMGFLW